MSSGIVIFTLALPVVRASLTMISDERVHVLPLFLGQRCIHGAWSLGAPLRSVPLLSECQPRISTLFSGYIEAEFPDYEAGTAYVEQTGKPVVVVFTG